MRILAYCFSCNKEHDISKVNIEEKGLTCQCGGYIISPTGKVNMKLIVEDNEDEKLLGISCEKTAEFTERPFPKVFKMNDYSWVCAMDKESAIAWYINNTGITEEELDIRECNINKETMCSEVPLSYIIKILREAKNRDNISFVIKKKYGSFFIEEIFREVIENMIAKAGYTLVTEQPFEICTTEW